MGALILLGPYVAVAVLGVVLSFTWRSPRRRGEGGR